MRLAATVAYEGVCSLRGVGDESAGQTHSLYTGYRPTVPEPYTLNPILRANNHDGYIRRRAG